MDDELGPVEEHEFVLRRVAVSVCRLDLAIPFSPAAFRPHETNDTDGLSVYREKAVTQAADVLFAVAEEKRGKFFVVRWVVRELVALGLTVVPSPEPDDIPGHCVIPELSWSNYQANKDRMKEVQAELACLAAQNIAMRPSQ